MIPPRFGSVFPASCASTLYTILSQWWFISTLQCEQIILSVLATTAILNLRGSVQRYLLAPLAQCLCHPDEFFQKLIDAPDVGLIEEFAVLGKHFLHTREIYIPEDRHQPDLPHHR